MYTDFLLRFPDEATADALLYTSHNEVVNEDGTVTAEAYRTPNYQNIDTIGVIVEGEVPLDGWHVNVRLVDGAEDGMALEPFRVFPEHPVRVWV